MEIVILIISLLVLGAIICLICIVQKNKTSINVDEMRRSLVEEMQKQKIEELKEKNLSDTQSVERLAKFENSILDRMTNTFDSIQIKLDQRLNQMDSKVTDSVTKGFTQTNETYNNLIERLAKIDEAQNNISSLSSDVISLRNVLDNNQNRGKFGEFTLERILFSVFGDAKNGVYATQYVLKDLELSERPDAVVFLPAPQNLICIDSKFPYQDYKRLIETKDETYKKEFAAAVKIHINDISRKYIIEGKTAAFALMFVPSDAIFGFINGELYELVEYARKKHVVIVSPSTLQPILATINMVQIDDARNKNVTYIIEQLKKLNVDFQKFMNDWSRFSKNLSQTINVKDEFDNRVNQIVKKFERIEKVNSVNEQEEN